MAVDPLGGLLRRWRVAHPSGGVPRVRGPPEHHCFVTLERFRPQKPLEHHMPSRGVVHDHTCGMKYHLKRVSPREDEIATLDFYGGNRIAACAVFNERTMLAL